MTRTPWHGLSLVLLLTVLCSGPRAWAGDDPLTITRIEGARPKNVIFILSDDHRYDVMGFMGHPFVETPHMDRMARRGVHFANAMVTTSLCSPSRASILTGQYMHHHGVVDNNVPTNPDTIFFPQYLQQVGYQTGFFGKWHMGGHSDAPRKGFDRWVSFRGQGHYYPPNNVRWSLNVDGQSVPQRGYISDEITDYALRWLAARDTQRPFFAYVSHKGVHGMFEPAQRHAGRYADREMPIPETMANTGENYAGKPMWLKNQRNSWHGVEFAYHQKTDIQQHYRLYCEALLGVDESIGRLLEFLEQNGLAEDTLVMYMGDNGFQWGEHGLIDKRTAYEASMRVPLMAYAPQTIPAGSVVPQVVANIDIGPTILEAAGLATPPQMDGRSFYGLARGQLDPRQWRDSLLYEYYWEWNFPHTPTTFALRDQRYKFIQYHGLWDTDELYDLQADPQEKTNLIHQPQHKQRVAAMRARLHEMLSQDDATRVPFSFKRGDGANLRLESGSKAAEFPPHVLRSPDSEP